MQVVTLAMTDLTLAPLGRPDLRPEELSSGQRSDDLRRPYLPFSSPRIPTGLSLLSPAHLPGGPFRADDPTIPLQRPC